MNNGQNVITAKGVADMNPLCVYYLCNIYTNKSPQKYFNMRMINIYIFDRFSNVQNFSSRVLIAEGHSRARKAFL